ncbi:MAG: hypothetical protein ACYC6X_03190 [Minisyncoccota bacterium]
MPNRMEGGSMNKGSADDKKPAEIEDLVTKVKRLMAEHGIDKRLEEKRVEGPLATAPEDERKNNDTGKIGNRTPLSKIPGVIKDAQVREKQMPREKTEEDNSSE